MIGITGAQIRMARGYLRWSVKTLAEASGVAESTIKRMEEVDGLPNAKGANIRAVLNILKSALADEGVELLHGNGSGPGIRLKVPE